MTYEEMTEVAISPAALANFVDYEYRVAETEMLRIVTPSTAPHGLLIPFPGAPVEYSPLPARGRHLKPPRMIPTWRLVALATSLGAAGALVLDLVIR